MIVADIILSRYGEVQRIKQLRIFYACHDSPNRSALPQSRVWYNNLYLPLIDLGHEVVRFDYNLNSPNVWQKKFIDEKRPQLDEALLHQIRDAHKEKRIDLFFSYFSNANIRPEVIDKIRSLGIVTMNWYCNASYQFDTVSEIAPAYDYCLVPEKFRLADYRRIGANPIYFQEAANPNIYKPYPLDYQYDVTFVGQKYGDRPEFVKHLLDTGIDIHVFGPNWKPELSSRNQIKDKIKSSEKVSLYQRIKKHTPATFCQAVINRLNIFKRAKKKIEPIVLPERILGRILDDKPMIQMYSKSRINLGFSSCWTEPNEDRILQVRLRDFEVPMSGGFYIVEYQKELEEFFEIGKEIICYENKEDIAEKVKYYLSHDQKRENIRQAGMKRARAEHTWQKRFEKVFREIGLT